MNSVLQDWVMELPLREQGTLLTCVRGCDLAPKHPYDSPERRLTSWLRWCFMVPHDQREVDIPGAFFSSKVPTDIKGSEFGHYPQHWYAHVMHACEVIAYRHPNREVRIQARTIYYSLTSNLHLIPEDDEMMVARLSEDRIGFRPGGIVTDEKRYSSEGV